MRQRAKGKIIMSLLGCRYHEALTILNDRNKDIHAIEETCGVTWEEAARFVLIGEELGAAKP